MRVSGLDVAPNFIYFNCTCLTESYSEKVLAPLSVISWISLHPREPSWLSSQISIIQPRLCHSIPLFLFLSVLTLRAGNCSPFPASLACAIPRTSCSTEQNRPAAYWVGRIHGGERGLSWGKSRIILWHYIGYGVWKSLMVHSLLFPARLL